MTLDGLSDYCTEKAIAIDCKINGDGKKHICRSASDDSHHYSVLPTLLSFHRTRKVFLTLTEKTSVACIWSNLNT